jgi:hypothetical protein
MTQFMIAHISDIHAGSPCFVPSLIERVAIELEGKETESCVIPAPSS